MAMAHMHGRCAENGPVYVGSTYCKVYLQEANEKRKTKTQHSSVDVDEGT